MNYDTMAAMIAIMMNNALTLDTVVNAELGDYDGTLWYEKAFNDIVEASARYGINYAIMARIIAHLSIATFWDRQKATLDAVAHAISLYNGNNHEYIASLLEVGTLYNKTALQSLAYIDSFTPILDTPKKTHQFYAAIMTREDHYYVSDSHDLQYKGCMTINADGTLKKHKGAIEKIMGSENAYTMQLQYERALNDGFTPISRQARRWVWKSDNDELLRANRHPRVTYDVIECPVHDTPMIKWRLR